MTITITRKGAIGAFVALFIAIFALLSACSSVPTAQQVEGQDQADVSAQYVKNQPIPKPLTSQMRQNLIEIEKAQADGVQTTSFFFNPNVADPYLVCPSVGTPISAAASLSNPQQLAIRNYGSGNYANGVVDQMDPNGVYTPADSLGTYAMCIQANGAVVPTYSEGYVHVEYAPAQWDKVNHQVLVTGAPTAHFTKGK